MPHVPERIRIRILHLLARATRVLELRLTFHDLNRRSGRIQPWTTHENPACVWAKETFGTETCVAYDSRSVDRVMEGLPEGRIHQCPHGFTEIAMPVFNEGLYAGVLYAGPCWLGEDDPPHPWLKRPPGLGWLEDRRTLLRAVANELGDLLRGELSPMPVDRRQRILHYLGEALERPVTLNDLAEELDLSPSRTGHLVRELFGLTFPQLANAVKLREASHLLTSTDLGIAEVASRVGIDDPNYFSRLFKQRQGISPRAYRNRYPPQA